MPLLPEFKQAIRDLPDDALQNVHDSLKRSIAKLEETNDYFRDMDSQERTESDDETIGENEQVIAKQNDQLDAVNQELRQRGLDVPEQILSL